MKLNYRDKVILGVLLALVLLIAGFFLLIKPKNEDIKTDKAALAELQKQRDEVDSKIAEIPGIKDDITKSYNEASALAGDFVDYNSIFNARKVDQYMQKFAEENEVKVSTLAAGDIGTGTLDYYYFTPSFVGEDMLSQADINGSQQQIIAKEKAESAALSERTAETALQAQYTINVSGEKENIWNYMKAIEEQKETIIINSVGLTDIEIKEREDAAPTNEEEEKVPTAQFTITLYSVYEMDAPNLEMAE